VLVRIAVRRTVSCQCEPQRLHPGEPFPIVPGVVDMADEVSFT
jgi:hypothetical protein